MEMSELMPYVRHEIDAYDDIELVSPGKGKVRNLSVPRPKLMHIQKLLLAGTRVDWESSSTKSIPHAYIPKRSILTAAAQHPNTKSGFKIDLKDFFGHVSAEAIEYNWSRNQVRLPRHEAELAKAFIALSTRTKPDCGETTSFLPQGAPPSGLMSNIAARRIDVAVAQICDKFGLRVTRYADDILFTSTNALDRSVLEQALEEAQGSIRTYGFEVNASKTRILTPGSRMEVLGVMLGGETPRLSRTKRRKIESEIRGIVKFGLLSHALERHRNPEALYRSLRGYLAFAYPLEKEWASRQIALLQSAVKDLYAPN